MNKESGTRFAKAAALVGAGALGASILTGVAFAADPTPAPSASSSTESERGGMGDRRGPDGVGDHGRDGKRGGMLGGFGGNVLHGEATVENEDGTTERVRAVRGEVTAISAESITVRAADGFTQTYAINADTKVHVGRGDDASVADIAVGYQAMVAGSINGESATAKMIGALSPADAAEMEQKMAERRAEMEQRMAERDQNESPSQEG